jgi:hypothetical protein
MKRKMHRFARRQLCIESLEVRNLLSSVAALSPSLAEQPMPAAEAQATSGNIVEVAWQRPPGASCPPSRSWRTTLDIDGDGRRDWYFGNFVTDDLGNRVDIWCINRGIGFYATVFNDQYHIGKCPYNSGINTWTATYIEDSNGSGTPDALLSVKHVSRDGGRDDVGNWLWEREFRAVRGPDRMQWEFDVPSNELVVTQFDGSGAVVKSVTQCPPNITGNRTPVAVAGPEQWHRDLNGDGFATVTLDGSASSDPDGHIHSYEWAVRGLVLGDTAVLTTNFSVGWHEVTLTVSDCASKKHSDKVIINVRPPLPTPVQVRVDQPYGQDFSSGIPEGSQGWELYSTHEGRIAVVNGRLRMDDRVNNRTYSQNEAILHVDLLGQSHVQLSGGHWRLRDVADSGDGIAISADGVTWHRVTAFNVAATGAFVVNLDKAIAEAGISYTSQFHIKFQQYGNRPATRNGREWDDIKLEVVVPQVVRPGQSYFQDFSHGMPGNSQGWEYRSTNAGRIEVVDGWLRMDDRVNNRTFSQNEAILHVDLLGQSNVQLSGYHRNLRDRAHAGDGIAISADGEKWHRVRAFKLATTGEFLVDLDAAIAAAGISYTSDFRIKFQQYGNRPAPRNGREWDDILVEVVQLV